MRPTPRPDLSAPDRLPPPPRLRRRRAAAWLAVLVRPAAICVVLLVALVRPAAALPAGQVNVTDIVGTWSSGSGAIVTGPSFINPLTYTFSQPAVTGISYSFTADGHFEEAQYRYTGNGTSPHCITAVLIWQHGTYQLLNNGSITTQPIAADGRIQVQNRCTAQSSVITYYYQPALFQGWQITNDINHGQYMLQLVAFDGSFLPRQYLTFKPPTMWSTNQLTTNATAQNANIAAGAGFSKTGGAATLTASASVAGVVLLLASIALR